MKIIKSTYLDLLLNSKKIIIKNFIFTNLDKYLVIFGMKSCLYFIDTEKNKIEFEKNIDIGDSSVEIFPISNTNDFIIFNKNESKVVYIEFGNSVDVFELKDFCHQIQVSDSNLCVWSDESFSLYNLDTIKANRSFNEKLFNKIYLENTSFDTLLVQLNTKFLAVFEKPRSLSLFRFECSNLIKIANVPIHDEIREIVITDRFLTVRLKNYRIVSFKIVTNVEDDFLKIIESNTQNRYFKTF
jgi:hypothetical protein